MTFSESVDNRPKKIPLHFGDVLDFGGTSDLPKIIGDDQS